MTTTPSAGARAALDDSQLAVLDAPETEPLIVIGAPGSGKTRTLVELLAARVGGGSFAADEVLALVPGRAQATSLRDRLAARLGGTVSGARARTPQSLAFEIVREHRAARSLPPPRLLTGADHDALIRELLDGRSGAAEHFGFVAPIDDEVIALAGFRAELRDLLSAMSEYDVTPDELASLGAHHPSWRGAAAVAREIETVLAWQGDGLFDVAGLLLEAASILHDDARDPLAIDRVRLIAVDDAQELTEAARRLLVALESRGATIVTFGDPDTATGVFRGGGGERAVGWRSTETAAVRRILLSGVHRHDAGLRALVARVTANIGVRGEGRQRAALAIDEASTAPSEVFSLRASSPVAEATAIAAALRRLHLERGIAWSDMAVIVRSGAAIPTLARLLARGEVPTSMARQAGAQADPAVTALVRLAALAADPDALSGELVADVLASPLFGVDGLRMRQFRRALRVRETQAGGDRSSDALLVEAVLAPGGTAGLADPEQWEEAPEALTLRRNHPAVVATRRLAKLLQAAAKVAAVGAADEVLWAVWEGTGLADTWRRRALAGGPEGEAADARLDAVVALFDVAKRVVERTPDTSILQFIEDWESRDVAADSLGGRADRDAVTLGTPAAVVGREFRAVVVARVNEDVWPNLRLRDSLLGAQRLVEVVTGLEREVAIVDRRRAVLDDEARMFAQAVSRAREWLLVTAVASDDTSPSTFFNRLGAPELAAEATALPVTFRALTGTLRGQLRAKRAASASSLDGRLDPAAVEEPEVAALAKLANLDVPGAHPDEWLGVRQPTTTRAVGLALGATQASSLAAEGTSETLVRVSPSKIARVEECGINWFVTNFGGQTTSVEMSMGTLVHAAAEYAFPSRQARRDYIQGRLGELQAESPWRAIALERRLGEMIEVLEMYLDDRRAAGSAVLGVERPFVVDIPVQIDGAPVTVRLSGTIDRLEQEQSGTVRIVDFKTGKSKLSTNKASVDPQLAAYQFGVRRDGIGEAAPASPELDPAPSADSGRPISVPPDALGGALLLYVAGTKPGEVLQPAMNDDADVEFERRIVRAALTMAGLAPAPVGDPLESLDVTRAATFVGQLDNHCTTPHGPQPACRIHVVPEVTE